MEILSTHIVYLNHVHHIGHQSMLHFSHYVNLNRFSEQNYWIHELLKIDICCSNSIIL